MGKLIAQRPFFWKKRQYNKGDEVPTDQDTKILLERNLVKPEEAKKAEPIEGETKELKIKRTSKPKTK